MLKTKLPKAENWPCSKPMPAIPAVKYSKTSVKDISYTDTKNKSGKDSRPWNTTKVAPYDKQT